MKETIVQIGDPVLRETAKPIAIKDIGSRKIQALIKKMLKTLASEEYGVALAAPQLGVPVRLFVVAGRVFHEDEEEDMDSDTHKHLDRVYINPELTRMSRKKVEMSEGCLSVRGQYGTVLRHQKATIKAVAEDGQTIHEHASGLLAHIFQHEVDHLNGILFVDKAEHTEPWEDFKKRTASRNSA